MRNMAETSDILASPDKADEIDETNGATEMLQVTEATPEQWKATELLR